MKKLFFLVPLLFAVNSWAQTGWQWSKGNLGGGIDAYDVSADFQGNIYIAGVQGSDAVILGTDTVPNHSGYISQTVIAKSDMFGSILWARYVDSGESMPMAITNDRYGNLVVLGIFNSAMIKIGTYDLYMTPGYAYQYFIVKYSSSGAVLWADTSASASGFTGLATGLSGGGVITDSAGNIYITGNFTAASATIGAHVLANPNPGGASEQVFVAKYDATGNPVWGTSIGGTGDDEAYGITITRAGQIYICGDFNSAVMNIGASALYGMNVLGTAFVAEVDTSGVPGWGIAASGSADRSGAISIISDTSGNIYTCGFFFDPSLIVLGTDTIRRIYTTSGGMYSAGFAFKLSPAHSVLWSKTLDGQGAGQTVVCYSIAQGPCNQVWVSGYFEDSANIGDTVIYRPPGSNDPAFLAGYFEDGSIAGHSALQSGGDDMNSIVSDGRGNIIMCGDYEISPFYIGSDTLYIPPLSGTEYLFFAKYAAPTTCYPLQTETVKTTAPSVYLYPNPAASQITIECAVQISGVVIMNAMGQCVYAQQWHGTAAFHGERITMDISALPAGIYFAKVNDEVLRFVKK